MIESVKNKDVGELKNNVNLNRYQIDNAAFIIDGYFVRVPNKTEEDAFLRAREEAVASMKRSLANVEMLTLDQFLVATKRKR